MNQRMSDLLKARWEDCRVIGEKLNINKTKVHNFLYQDIKEKGWIEQAKNGDQEIIDQIKELPGWARMISEPPPLIIHDDEETPVVKRKFSNREICTSPEQKLRISMWFIERFASPEEAFEALKVAVDSVKKLRKQGLLDE